MKRLQSQFLDQTVLQRAVGALYTALRAVLAQILSMFSSCSARKLGQAFAVVALILFTEDSVLVAVKGTGLPYSSRYCLVASMYSKVDSDSQKRMPTAARRIIDEHQQHAYGCALLEPTVF